METVSIRLNPKGRGHEIIFFNPCTVHTVYVANINNWTERKIQTRQHETRCNAGARPQGGGVYLPEASSPTDLQLK